MSQRTTLSVGVASADIALVLASAKPNEAKHETRRVPLVEDAAAEAVRSAVDTAPQHVPEAALALADPSQYENEEPIARQAGPDEVTGSDDPFGDDGARSAVQAEPKRGPAKRVKPEPTERVEQGVWREVGDDRVWVNLSEQLAEIDERNKKLFSGIVVEDTVPRGSLPAHLVREAHYVVPQGENSNRFAAHVWAGLRDSNSAAVVRFTKRTAQYLGLLVAAGTAKRPYLQLLVVEWAENVRDVPAGAYLDLNSVPAEAAAAAASAMESLRTPGIMSTLRDERNAERAQLLDAARHGRKWRVPKRRVMDAVDRLGEALLAGIR